jgi:hypothetical protein
MLIISLTDLPTPDERTMLTEIGAEIVETRHFTGAEQTVNIIVQLSAAILPALLTYLALKLRAQSRMSISYKDLVLTGFSEETAERILKEILAREQRSA